VDFLLPKKLKNINKILPLFLFPISVFCQNTIGLPDVINYNKKTYNGGLQNWDVKQGPNGIIYFANNEGLLSFDGKYWKVYPLPNKTIVRSVEFGNDNKIYVGGQDEVGYFEPNKNGNLIYHSFVPLIAQKDRLFGDVWDIVFKNGDVFFRGTSQIIKITNNSSIIYKSHSEWSYMGMCNGSIYAQDAKNGLMLFKENAWMPVETQNSLPNNDPISSIFIMQKTKIFITTLKNGFFTLNNNLITPIESSNLNPIVNQRFSCAIPITDDWMALGTNNDGVYIINTNGELVQKFSKNEGIQNSNVLSITLDNQKNIWLGLNNGIDFINYDSPIKQLNPNNQKGSGYTAAIFKSNLYIGTSNGLYYAPLQTVKDLSFSKGDFNFVNNTAGQNWMLSEINNKLLLGHHEGAFDVNEGNAVQLSREPGFWNFTPVTNVFPTSRCIAGNYNGIRFFNYNNNQFVEGEKIPDFIESSRYVVIDKFENYWISHPYHGVFKIQSNQNGKFIIKQYTEKNGLPLLLDNQVYKIKNELLIATQKGIYKYNPQKDLFEVDEFYKNILSTQSVRYLKEDNEGNVWFIHEKQLGVIDFSTTKPSIIYLPELNNKMLSGFEFIYPVNKNNIFLGGEIGFFHINYEKYKQRKTSLLAKLSAVKIFNLKDSLLFGGNYAGKTFNETQQKADIPHINYKWNSIHFEYSTSIYGQESNLEYAYKLSGQDKDWSEWTSKSEKDYTNLSPGNYTFELKARNNLGNESKIVSYQFEIVAPWYRSYFSYFLYAILIVWGLSYVYAKQRKKLIIQKQKHDEEQKRLSYLHQLEIDKASTELINLRNEKLQSEIDFKNSELATSAMHLVQKGEILTKIKSELTQLMKSIDDPSKVSEIKKIIKVVSEDEKVDKDWEHFAQHFDKVHSDFMVILKEKHDNITPNELKLCTYLRMNLSTKEIAQLLNITVRGIEISRYRLRKKLGIKTEVTLFDYLMSIKGG
jgi:DNA-binding CsgD family transcriptional regulator